MATSAEEASEVQQAAWYLCTLAYWDARTDEVDEACFSQVRTRVTGLAGVDRSSTVRRFNSGSKDKLDPRTSRFITIEVEMPTGLVDDATPDVLK